MITVDGVWERFGNLDKGTYVNAVTPADVIRAAWPTVTALIEVEMVSGWLLAWQDADAGWVLETPLVQRTQWRSRARTEESVAARQQTFSHRLNATRSVGLADLVIRLGQQVPERDDATLSMPMIRVGICAELLEQADPTQFDIAMIMLALGSPDVVEKLPHVRGYLASYATAD